MLKDGGERVSAWVGVRRIDHNRGTAPLATLSFKNQKKVAYQLPKLNVSDCGSKGAHHWHV